MFYVHEMPKNDVHRKCQNWTEVPHIASCENEKHERENEVHELKNEVHDSDEEESDEDDESDVHEMYEVLIFTGVDATLEITSKLEPVYLCTRCGRYKPLFETLIN